MMKSGSTGACVVLLSILFVSRVGQVQALEPALFQSMNLIHFDRPIELPDVRLMEIGGKEMRLRAWQGKVLLLNFWTTW
jgi:hypothetical protein